MGTHPIFESDFDCLTEFTMLRKPIYRVASARPVGYLGTGRHSEKREISERSLWEKTLERPLHWAKDVFPVFNKVKPRPTLRDYVEMMPLSLQKLELDSLEQGIDIFAQFDADTPFAPIGSGTRDDPFVVWSYDHIRVCAVDKTQEAPGVQGMGGAMQYFLMTPAGDGESGEGVRRWKDGSFYKFQFMDMPEIAIADDQSHFQGHLEKMWPLGVDLH